MKLNKSKNKGKVHPSPSSSSFSPNSNSNSNSNQNDTVSTLNKLLPAAILTLISILSLQDKEVLAYMITHSLSSSSSFFTSSTHHGKNNKKNNNNNNKSGKKSVSHTIPTFDCGCFECYTTYWFRWDSSPHRELIHQAIEAFEEHLAASEQLHSNKLTPPKSSRRKDTNKVKKSDGSSCSSSVLTPAVTEVVTSDVIDKDSPEIPTESRESPSAAVGDDVAEVEERQRSGVQHQHQQQHKGLARKVLPDVIGLFNSRLWNLWGPNV